MMALRPINLRREYISREIHTEAQKDLNIQFVWDYCESNNPITIRHWIEEILTLYNTMECRDCGIQYTLGDGCNKVKCPNCVKSFHCGECRSFINKYSHFESSNDHFCQMYSTPERVMLIEQRRLDVILSLARDHSNYQIVKEVIDQNFRKNSEKKSKNRM